MHTGWSSRWKVCGQSRDFRVTRRVPHRAHFCVGVFCPLLLRRWTMWNKVSMISQSERLNV